jgi:hypothetical protein
LEEDARMAGGTTAINLFISEIGVEAPQIPSLAPATMAPPTPQTRVSTPRGWCVTWAPGIGSLDPDAGHPAHRRVSAASTSVPCGFGGADDAPEENPEDLAAEGAAVPTTINEPHRFGTTSTPRVTIDGLYYFALSRSPLFGWPAVALGVRTMRFVGPHLPGGVVLATHVIIVGQNGDVLFDSLLDPTTQHVLEPNGRAAPPGTPHWDDTWPSIAGLLTHKIVVGYNVTDMLFSLRVRIPPNAIRDFNLSRLLRREMARRMANPPAHVANEDTQRVSLSHSDIWEALVSVPFPGNCTVDTVRGDMGIYHLVAAGWESIEVKCAANGGPRYHRQQDGESLTFALDDTTSCPLIRVILKAIPPPPRDIAVTSEKNRRRPDIRYEFERYAATIECSARCKVYSIPTGSQAPSFSGFWRPLDT